MRVVYNDSSAGLNRHLWAPWFSLSTTLTLLRAMEGGTWMADLDIGEMFEFYLGGAILSTGGIRCNQLYVK
jgi:hypothetical protein